MRFKDFRFFPPHRPTGRCYIGLVLALLALVLLPLYAGAELVNHKIGDCVVTMAQPLNVTATFGLQDIKHEFFLPIVLRWVEG